MKILAYFQALWLLAGCVSWFPSKPSVPQWLPDYQAAELKCGDWNVLPDEISRRELINFDSGRSRILSSYWLRSGTKAYAFENLDDDGDVERDGDARFFVDADQKVIAGYSRDSLQMIATLQYDEGSAAIISFVEPGGELSESVKLPYQLDELVYSNLSHDKGLTLLSRFYEASGASYHWTQIQLNQNKTPIIKQTLKLSEKQINDVMPVRLAGHQSSQALAYISKGDAIQLSRMGSKKSLEVFSVADLGEEMIDFEYTNRPSLSLFALTTRNPAGETISRFVAKASGQKNAVVTKLEIGGREILTPKFVQQNGGPMLLGVYQELGQSHLVGFQLDKSGSLKSQHYFMEWAGEVSLVAAHSTDESGAKLFFGRRHKGDKTQFFCALN